MLAYLVELYIRFFDLLLDFTVGMFDGLNDQLMIETDTNSKFICLLFDLLLLAKPRD